MCCTETTAFAYYNLMFRAAKIFDSRNVFLAVIDGTGCGFQVCDTLWDLID